MSNKLVLVEDIVSAIKVARVANSLGLLGTFLSDEGLRWAVSSGFTEFYVWLDNDNHQVRTQQVRLRDRLELFGTAVIVKTALDPKEYTTDQIRRILDV